MTKEEIIQMLRASCDKDRVDPEQNGFWVIVTEELVSFAKLVAEKAIKEALAQPTSGDYALGYSIGFGEGHSAGKALAQPEHTNTRPWYTIDELSEWIDKYQNQEWRNAAIMLGEKLSSVGPDGYYNMEAKDWLDWAMENVKLAQPEQDNTYIYASSLATAIWQKHYMKESPKFALLDTTEGVLTQIDNMTCGLVREKTAQPEQKYHRGDRLICLETEEYCVIHISGTDRQWVKFPDSHIGVYTNEQVAELFELLPKDPELEPVGQLLEDAFGRGQVMWFNKPKDESMLYTTPPQRNPLTDDEMWKLWNSQGDDAMEQQAAIAFARDIEAAHNIKE